MIADDEKKRGGQIETGVKDDLYLRRGGDARADSGGAGLLTDGTMVPRTKSMLTVSRSHLHDDAIASGKVSPRDSQASC